MKQEGKSFGENGRTHMREGEKEGRKEGRGGKKKKKNIGHQLKGRDHNMENTTVICDVKFSGLTEKTATFKTKQSTKRPRHYVPENHNLHIHCYLNLKSQNTAVTGTHSNDQQLWSKNAGNWQKWEEEEKNRESRKIEEIIKVL